MSPDRYALSAARSFTLQLRSPLVSPVSCGRFP